MIVTPRLSADPVSANTRPQQEVSRRAIRPPFGYPRHMLAEHLAEHDDTPVEDKIVVLYDATWADYQRLMEMRGDKSVPRLAYLEGALEIMTPSRPHESLKSMIGRLVE